MNWLDLKLGGRMLVAANVQEEKILHDFLEWRQSLRSLTDVGAWRDSSRNLIVNA